MSTSSIFSLQLPLFPFLSMSPDCPVSPFLSMSVSLPLSSSSAQLWVEERLPLAKSQEQGHNLQTVQMLQKKHQARDQS